MARKPNYDFEKRRKEMDRKAKKDAKREERQRRSRESQNQNSEEPARTMDDEGGPPAE